MNYIQLSHEMRGDVYDLSHFGNICVVDENGNVLHALGNPETLTCYRSSSKPLQALATLKYDLDTKYGITDEETVIFAASHAAEKFHVDALESILKKTGLKEEYLIMNPTYPANEAHKLEIISNRMPKRKLYHNCSGKHLAAMILQQHLGGDPKDYWKEDSLAQQEIKKVLCQLSETDDALVSLDGCGVPVFTVPLKNIAIAYKNLACPDKIKDELLKKAAEKFVPRMHKYPLFMRGTGFICSIMNMDENIVAKGGANAVYGFSLKNQRLGISFKIADGTEDAWPIVILQILKDLNALKPEHEARIMELKPYNVYNDTNTLAAKRVCDFTLKN